MVDITAYEQDKDGTNILLEIGNGTTAFCIANDTEPINRQAILVVNDGIVIDILIAEDVKGLYDVLREKGHYNDEISSKIYSFTKTGILEILNAVLS